MRPTELRTPEDGVPLEIPEGDPEPLEEREEPQAYTTGAPFIPPQSPKAILHGGERVIPTELWNRAQAARSIQPAERHWLSAWEQGRDFAVAAITKGEDVSDVKAVAAPLNTACRDCWTKGRDAAVKAIEGD